MLSFMLSACSYEIKVSTKINDDCSVDILFPDGELQVEHLLVAEAKGDNFDLSNTVWEIGGKSTKVHIIKYGDLPAGFNELSSSKSLVSGNSYYIAVKGPGGGFGAVRSEYICE